MHKCPFWSKVFSKKAQNYYDLLKNAAEVSRKEYIIDSSKWSEPLYYLREYKDNVYVIYLVRDGRGTLWSYYKKYGKTLKHIIFWIIYNFKVRYFIKYYPNKIFIHYYDFCKEPIRTLEYIFRKFKIPYKKEDLLNFDNIERHTIEGNLRFVRKIGGIKCHDEWKQKLNKYQKLQFYLLAGLLNLYLMSIKEKYH